MDLRHRKRKGRRATGTPHGHSNQRNPQPEVAVGTGAARRFLVIGIELLGIRSLSFAVGAYLSIGTTLAIFTGGLMRWMVDSAVKKAGGDADAEGDVSPGSLYASGLIAAGGIIGLLGVGLKLYETTFGKEDPIAMPHSFLYHDWVSVLAFAALAFSLYYFARKPLKK